MAPRRIAPEYLASVLPPGGLTLVSACAAESALLHAAVQQAGPQLGAMQFGGIFVPGLNRRSWIAGPDGSMLTFFMTPELRAQGAAVEFLPLCYQDVLRELRRRRPSAALFMCAPPDRDGRCSFGVQADFLPELWREIPVRIAHINPRMPATRGHAGIAFHELSAWCEAEEELLVAPEESADEVAAAIAARIAAHIPDRATVQIGIGRIPAAVLRGLRERRGLRLHSGLVGDAVLELIEAGALAAGPAITTGLAIGSRTLYDAAATDRFLFQPVSVTHDAATLARIERLVTVNSALEVDLFGQAYTEIGPGGLLSGPGGATDFARGARLGGGLRIVALPAQGGKQAASRIVAPGAARGPVSLARTDIDLVVTEHGVADLRGGTHAQRAAALCAIAAPAFREDLQRRWREFERQL